MPYICASQVDPQLGSQLSQEFSVEEQQITVLNSRLNALSTNRQYNKTYDFHLVSGNLFDSHILVDQIRNDIYSLNYDKAGTKLGILQTLIRATATILDEDTSLPEPNLERESIFDQNRAPSESIPASRGPALRAAIGSELSFSERLLAKAGVLSPFAGSVPSHGPNATPCTDAQDRLAALELKMEKDRGYSDTGDFGERNSFFAMAITELRLLHYPVAHEMALKTYVEGQRILSICSTEYGNSNPASIIVTPGGSSQDSVAGQLPHPQDQTQDSVMQNTTDLSWFPHPVDRVKISAAVAAGLLSEKAEPVYPPLAQAAHVSGAVVLDVFISEAGDVQDIRVISGPSMLQDSAVDAVRKWHYRPYKMNNQPVPVETTVRVQFSL